ncbi:MAG: hypothetical protein H6767_06370 [Candidatus Peribacteria bacterium]|nr:MAG: hypothetical protein H6767_06370 [Candidatus Peribacteria bacterium]
MIFDFLKKQKDIRKKKRLIETMILSLNISDDHKFLYLEAIKVLDKEGLEELFVAITAFTEKVELKQLEDIKKENFSSIAGMKKKEAIEKQKELNAFSFLINNL